jgi:hypothetical protein
VIPALAYALTAVGAAGMVWQSVCFVRVTLPHHYGLNPGFGAYETSVAPWWGALCVGLGLLAASARLGIVLFAVGFLALGLVAQLLGAIFGRRSP